MMLHYATVRPALLITCNNWNWRLTFIEAVRHVSDQQTQKPVSVTDMKKSLGNVHNGQQRGQLWEKCRWIKVGLRINNYNWEPQNMQTALATGCECRPDKRKRQELWYLLVIYREHQPPPPNKQGFQKALMTSRKTLHLSLPPWKTQREITILYLDSL